MSPTGHLRADAERNVRAIIEAAITLLAAEPDASMERVAVTAGVGRATVYRHFASREHLVRAILDQALQDARDAILSSRPEEGTALEALERAVNATLKVADRYRLVRQIPRGDTELRARAEEVGAPLTAIFERGQRSGELRSDLPARWAAAALGALIQAVTVALIDGEIRERDATARVCTTLVDGMTARAHAPA
jgi:AcrR family transcriptional regulator